MNEIAEYSSIVVIVLFLIKEMFSYLKGKQNNKNGDSKKDEKDKAIQECQSNIATIKLQLSNHLDHVKGDISGIQTDVKIMRNDLDEIKMILKK